jgi:hypothetical protein
MTKYVELSSITGSSSMSVADLKIRSSLIEQRIFSAVMFAKQAGNLEKQFNKETVEKYTIKEHRGYVIAAITECGAFLESTISEFLCNIKDDCSQVPILNDQLKHVFKVMFEDIEKMSGVINKFNKVLELCQISPINLGENPGQDAETVIDLRNNLVHYKPKWRGDTPSNERKEKRISQLEKRLNSNPFIEGNPFFPHQCLSYDCAKWAIETCIQFNDQFHVRIQMKPPYDRNELLSLMQ